MSNNSQPATHNPLPPRPTTRNPFLFLLLVLFLVTAPFSSCVQKKLLTETDSKWFQIAVLPDTQYYTALRHGGTLEMFDRQINWIKQNQEKEKIAYVAHAGDITDHGEEFMEEWQRARDMMYRLEAPLPGRPNGIPYGVAVGNHDSSPNGTPRKLQKGYEVSFGAQHFKGQKYYGGANSKAGDNHYDLFSAAGQKFIVLYLAYNEPGKPTYDAAYQKEVFEWAGGVLQEYSDRKAIVVSHSILKKPAGSNSNYVPGMGKDSVMSSFTRQGKSIYHHFKKYGNIFLMLCGHISGEGYRAETYQGNTIRMYLADYQSRRNPPYTENDRNGGNGLMRLMKFNLADKTISVRTIAPEADGSFKEETDEDSRFTHPLSF